MKCECGQVTGGEACGAPEDVEFVVVEWKLAPESRLPFRIHVHPTCAEVLCTIDLGTDHESAGLWRIVK